MLGWGPIRIICAGVFLASSFSIAAEVVKTPGNQTQQILTTPSSHPLSDYITVLYKGEFYGPRFIDVTGLRPNLVSGLPNNPSDKVRLENKVTLAYKLNPSRFLGVTIEGHEFALTGFQMRDPYLFIRDSAFFHHGQFNIDAMLRVYLGVTDPSRQATNLGSIKLIFDMSYPFANNRFGLGLYTYAQVFAYQTRPLTYLDQRYNFTPSVNYRFNPKVTAILAYKAWANHAIGKPELSYNNEPNLLEPAVSWNIFSTLNVYPYLDFSPNQGMSLNTTTFGMNVSWQLI